MNTTTAPDGDRGLAIEAHGLTRAFGDKLAVKGIDLAVGRSEIYGFLGPNGAGKTTTVRMLATLMRPTAGSAQVAGHDVATQPAAVRMRIGVALQEALRVAGRSRSRTRAGRAPRGDRAAHRPRPGVGVVLRGEPLHPLRASSGCGRSDARQRTLAPSPGRSASNLPARALRQAPVAVVVGWPGGCRPRRR